MLDRKIGIRQFDRSTLADLLQGSGPERAMTLGRWLESESFAGNLTAVWSLDQWGNHGFLPNLLTGSDSAITDLLAWSKVYLQGIGPLTGIMRVMTGIELQRVFESHPPIDLCVESLAPIIAICAGEVLARYGASASEQLLATSTVSNTLSFSLFRAQFVAPALERDEVVRRWRAVQSGSLDQEYDRITGLVIEMTDNAIRLLFQRDRWGKSYHYNRTFDFGEARSLSMSDLRHVIPAPVSRLFPDAFWEHLEELGAEQLVDMLDKIGPVLERTRDDTSASDRAELLAKLISRTNPEIDNQLELARPMLASLPEIGLWLAKYVADQSPGKLLSVNKGVGWKLAARLSSRFDPLTLPSADLTWQELQLGASSADMSERKRPSYRAVEIFSGHTVSRQTAHSSTLVEPAEKVTRRRSSRSKIQSPQEILAHAEQNLEEALYTLQKLRRRKY